MKNTGTHRYGPQPDITSPQLLSPLMGTLDMGGHRIINLSEPVDATDAATKHFTQNVSVNFSIPKKPSPSRIIQAGITRNMQLNFGEDNPLTFCITPAIAASAFTLQYEREGDVIEIGLITFEAGNTTATMSATKTVDLAVDDILQLIAPAEQDMHLSDVLITLVLLRQ